MWCYIFWQVGSTQLVHQCSWQQWVRSILAWICLFHNFFWNFICAACWDCASQVLLKFQTASKKARAHLKDQLERSLRPIQANQMTPGPFLTKQKRVEALQTSNKKLLTIFHWRSPTIHWASEKTVSSNLGFDYFEILEYIWIFDYICEYFLQIIFVFIFVTQGVKNIFYICIPVLYLMQTIFVFVFVHQKSYLLHSEFFTKAFQNNVLKNQFFNCLMFTLKSFSIIFCAKLSKLTFRMSASKRCNL